MIPLSNLVGLLTSVYGEVSPPSERAKVIDELIQTMLSQNTSDINTTRAFSSLKAAFPEWDMVLNAPVEDVVDAIRSGGLAEQKAPRIQAVLRKILDERGDFDLRFLKSMPPDAAMEWLTRLPGVGPKTAACTLLFSLNVPVMPVDTHVHRVALRVGLVPQGTSPAQTQLILGEGLTSRKAYEAHMLLIRHGRITCRARNPRCSECIVQPRCQYAMSVPA